MPRRLNIAAWQFRPRPWSMLATAAALALFCKLGLWQLQRAGENQALHEARRQALREAPTILSAPPGEGQQWRKVRVRGAFLGKPQILLDGQMLDGAAGYHVFAPFATEYGATLLVNRGWIAAGNDRRLPPPLKPDPGAVELIGILKPAPFSGIRLRNLPPENLAEGIWRVHNVDLTRLGDRMKIPLGGLALRLLPESEAGYMRRWREPPNKANTNRGYAFQWFSFAGLALILFIALNLKRQRCPRRP